MHTLKNQFIVLPLGQDIVDVRSASWKKRVNLFRATQNKFDALQTFRDKAYKGELAIITPDKSEK